MLSRCRSDNAHVRPPISQARMKKAACIPTFLFSFLLFLVSVVVSPAAQAQSFDMNALNQAATQPPVIDVANNDQQPSADQNGNLTGNAQFVPGAYNQTNLNGAIINVLGNITSATGTQSPNLPGAKMNLLAPGSAYGFNGLGDGPSIYRGVTGFQFGGILPGCKYAPIDANVVE